MNTKLVATIAIWMLLLSAFGMALHFAPARGDDEYITMTVALDPSSGTSPPPTLVPTVGTHVYPKDSQIEMSAPTVSAGPTGVQYVFLKWMCNKTIDGTYIGETTASEFLTGAQNDNYTYTSFYKTQYQFTTASMYDTPWVFDGSVWQGPGAPPSMSWWIDAGTTGVGAGLQHGLVEVPTGLYMWGIATFQNWFGAVTGTGDGTVNPQHSSTITMDGPKMAYANWTVSYWLQTDPNSVYNPWGGGPYNPDQNGYYANNTIVDLTAPDYDSINPGHWRWRFDYWIVQKWNGTAWNSETLTSKTIHVKMNQPTYATIYFWLQYYMTVKTSPANLGTGVETSSGYYDYCTYLHLVAPQYANDPADPTHVRWRFDFWVIWGYAMWNGRDITIHINGTTGDHEIIAYYARQYNVKVTLDPGTVPTSAIVKPLLGDNWFDEGATCNCTALGIVAVNSGEQWRFDKWTFNLWAAPDNPHVFDVYQAWDAVAHYVKQWHVRTYDEPIDGVYDMYDLWFDNNTLLNFVPPTYHTDYPYSWVLDYLKINTQTYPAGWASVHILEPLSATAYYKGVETFFISERNNIYNVPAASTTNFTITVTAANFKDLYAADFEVTWDPTLLEVVKTEMNVSLWHNPYYWEELTASKYHFVGTERGNVPGYTGQIHNIVKLTFHIIYDPCYIGIDYFRDCDLGLKVNYLLNSTQNQIWAEMKGGYYRINAIKPVFKLLSDGQKYVTKWMKDDTFTVTFSVEKATKLHSWYTEITYDASKLTVIGAQTIDTFLHRPYMVEVVNWATPGLVWFRVDKGTDLGTSTGAGVLATITFKVKQTIYWTNAYPEINDVINLSRVDIDFMCPDLHYLSSLDNAWAMDITDPIYYKYKPVPGDLNMDGVVDELDLGIIAHEYGLNVPPAIHDVIVTGGSAGKIDLFDLVAVALNFNRHAP